MRRVSSFPSYEDKDLPQSPDQVDTSGRNAGIPSDLLDTGPLDLSLHGSQRSFRLSAGWELIVHTDAPGTVVEVRACRHRANPNAMAED
jgi:hypothetical protein